MFRHVTVFLTLVTAGWWILLLISTFVTPPGLHMRGSGFFAFSNTTVALLVLILDLVFFGTPSKSTRILCACMAVRRLLFFFSFFLPCFPMLSPKGEPA